MEISQCIGCGCGDTNACFYEVAEWSRVNDQSSIEA